MYLTIYTQIYMYMYKCIYMLCIHIFELTLRTFKL